MAQTLFQVSKPAEQNCVINTLPLVLWSQNRQNAQFKYVLDVYYAGGSTRLTRVKFANNNAGDGGAGIVDLAPLVQSYLDYDQPWYTTGSSFTNNNNAARFTFVAGEEWATSNSSSTTIFDGFETASAPAFTASENNLYLAVQEFENGYDWDFNSYNGKWLTNQTYTSSAFPKIIYSGDFETISIMDNISGSQRIEVNSIEVSVKSGSTVLHNEDILSGQTSSADNQNILRYIGAGPQNLSNLNANFSSSFTGSWTTYTVYTDITINDNTEDVFTTYHFKNGECTNYDRTRFAFINKLGTWDYYNIDLPLRKRTKLGKKTTTRTHLQYQSIYANDRGVQDPTLATPIYDSDDRGLDLYYTDFEDTFRIQTDWLVEEQANWLTEMFNSPNVYIQIGSYFQPVNITSKEYKWKTNPRGQKVFQYFIEYSLSNQRTARY